MIGPPSEAATASSSDPTLSDPTPSDPTPSDPTLSDPTLSDPTLFDPPRPAVVEAVARALAEDLVPLGDLTAALVPPTVHRTVAVVSRSVGVLAGRACAIESIAQVDPAVAVDWRLPDGSAVVPGSVVAVLEGPLRSILTAERTALNFLGHLSGVASLTRQLVDAVAAANPHTRVLDTRKTTPGLRALEKAAVRAGGAFNHRGNLSEAVLVKDNHLGGVTITEAVRRARSLWPGRMVEVECDRVDQVASCVSLVRSLGGGSLVEVSGGVDLSSAPRYAAAGADLLSVGALTHSAPVLDLGLDLTPDASDPDAQGRN